MSDLNKKKREEESGEEKGTRKHGCLQLSRAFLGQNGIFTCDYHKQKANFKVNLNFEPNINMASKKRPNSTKISC